jgi:hypothetical protein
LTEYLPWQLAGTYLESCNCEAICPCRAIGGRAGGRSTSGLCLGALSWRIEEGRAGEADLAGLRVVLASRYHDDEPGSPWSFVLYIDELADRSQFDPLQAIYTGELGGTPRKQFPWAFKESHLVAVRPAAIEIDHTPGRGWFRAAGHVDVRIRKPFATTESVTCVIPGHHQPGREVVAETLSVHDGGPLEFEFEGSCGYEARFAYSSDE